MTPLALLLDFDGVVADTENHHVAAWQRTLAALGWMVPDAIASRAAEADDRDFLRGLFAEAGIEDADLDGWIARKQALTRELLRHSPRVYPGVHQLVERLRGRAKLGVVSGTWRENVEAVLESAGLADAFDVIVAKEDVKAPKPDPEGYATAVRLLGVKPKRAAALEDSPAGVAAAREAGLTCLAVGHRREFGPWVGDTIYFTGLEPVSMILRHLGWEDSTGAEGR
ncbi:Beta-phosphoglucomutase [Aquisphaera giovannonii]|uniref:Beta-phosphoglucomutase n=1 Tax=Aquisphaera giovannonii TaxID=406548 RepID=A0A5B9W9K1_9BACT|nr:HAD family phosphatase [Aquisphaera giovannonii]QEH37233.1 Beta-phosphoglucomutase [Aquisphaera giovannonii]